MAFSRSVLLTLLLVQCVIWKAPYTTAQGNHVTYHVTDNSPYQPTGLDLAGSHALIYSVKSTDGVKIGLQQSISTYSFMTGHTIMLSKPPKKSEIRVVVTQMAYSYELGKELSGTEPTWFWMCWTPDIGYMVGKGTTIGENMLMQHKLLPFYVISVASVWLALHYSTSVEAYVTIVNRTMTLEEVENQLASRTNIDQMYSGPVAITCETAEVPGRNISTIDGDDFVDVGLELGSVDSVSLELLGFKVTTTNTVALYHSDTTNFTATAYTIHLQLGAVRFVIGKGVGDEKSATLDYRYYLIVDGTPVWYWISWKNGRIAVGFGNTAGVNTSLYWDDPTPTPINRMKLMSSGADSDWRIPNRYYITGLARQQNQVHLKKKKVPTATLR